MMQQTPTANESNSPSSVVGSDARLEPTAKDIVFGRGKKYQDHEGNKRMRQHVNAYKQLYNALKRFQKQTLVETIYEKLVEDGARFLRKDEASNSWVLVDRELATQKVSHALRCKKHLGKTHPKDTQEANVSSPSVRQASNISTIDSTMSARCADLASHKKRMQVIEPTSEAGRATPAMNPIFSAKPVAVKAGLPFNTGANMVSPMAAGASSMPPLAAFHALQTLQMQDMLQRQRLQTIMDLQRQAQHQAQQQAASAYYNAAMNQILAAQNNSNKNNNKKSSE
ncbi:MAG: hypothetical protein SGBAC_011904 [Bacillariaceae sp.]